MDLVKIASNLVSKVLKAYGFDDITLSLANAYGEGMRDRLIERVIQRKKDEPDKAEYWNGQLERIKKDFTISVLKRHFLSVVSRFENKIVSKSEVADYIYEMMVSTYLPEEIKGRPFPDFEESNPAIFSVLMRRMNHFAVDLVKKWERRKRIYNDDSDDEEGRKQEQQVFDQEKAENAGKVDLDAEMHLFKDVWSSEIQPRLNANEKKFIEEMIKIFEANYPASPLSGHYAHFAYNIDKVKNLRKLINGMSELPLLAQIKKLGEIRTTMTVLKTRPYFQDDMAKINNLIVKISKDAKKTRKMSYSDLKSLEKIINNIDLKEYSEKRKKILYETWKSAMKKIYNVYYKVVTGQMTYAKIRRSLNEFTLNNQYSAAIQHAFGEVLVKFLRDSLQKNNPELYEEISENNARGQLFKNLESEFEIKKMQRIGSNLTNEFLSPEQMVLSLRKKLVTGKKNMMADVNVDDLDQRVDHLFNDSTDEVAPIGLYNNTIEYGPRCDTVNRFGKIAASLMNVSL